MDDEQPKKTPPWQIGQISQLSRGELEKAVDMLKVEIARIETEMTSKSASRDAAEAFFKR